MGDHGMAIMSEREGLSFGSKILSDSAPLNTMVEAIAAAAPHVHVLRDPTRGGLATTLNEIAAQSDVGIMLNEASIPVHSDVAQACEFLGLDPLYVANEGKLIAIVPEDEAEACLAAMKSAPHGEESAIVGTVTDEARGYVQMTTLMGGVRMVDWLNADQLRASAKLPGLWIKNPVILSSGGAPPPGESIPSSASSSDSRAA